MPSCLFIFANSARNATTCFEFFSESLLILFMLLSLLKRSGAFLDARTVFKREFSYSRVSGVVSPGTLVTKNEVLNHVEYSESYKNKQRREIQCLFWPL